MIENTKNTKIPETNDDIVQQIGDVEQRTPGRLRLLGQVAWRAAIYPAQHLGGTAVLGLAPSGIENITGWNNGLLDTAGTVTLAIGAASSVALMGAGITERVRARNGPEDTELGVESSVFATDEGEGNSLPPA